MNRTNCQMIVLMQWSATCGPSAAWAAVSCGPRTDSEIMHSAAHARNIA